MFSIILTFFLMALLVVVLTAVWWFVHPPRKPTVEYTDEIPTWNYSFRDYTQLAPLDRSNLRAEAQNPAWQAAMRNCGAAMRAAHVKHIYFIHGTFVGDDPAGIVDMMKSVYPNIEKNIASRLRRVLKKHTDTLLRDNGNFTQEYVTLAQNALSAGNSSALQCKLFHWSSGNHHWARLQGAVRLAHSLADTISAQRLNSSDRILLYGHSHAGQVFALLAQLLEYDQFGFKLVEILQDVKEDVIRLHSSLALIRGITLNFVTMGSPLLYAWPDSGYYQLLNLINHRGTSHLAGSLDGILHTRDGDYIQQLGIQGTDLIATTAKERELNRKLDDVFGYGRSLKNWRMSVEKKMRVSPFGKTYLIDYGDSSRIIPNFFKTLFGHGVYTRYETMLFTFQITTEYFYKHKPR